jgi:uncharacterized SAM-binding protein YcdF (DUF218 family)
MSILRRAARAFLGLVLLAAVALVAAFVVVLSTATVDERRPADAIVVLGAAQYNGRPSPVLQARLDHALTLYRAGLAPKVMLTGGVGRGDVESEATVGKRYLTARGVPASAISLEAEGRSTGESMTAVAAWVKKAKVKTVILVSDPFHMARLRVEARRTGIIAYLSPTTTSPISENPRRELGYLLAESWKVPVAWVQSLIESPRRTMN